MKYSPLQTLESRPLKSIDRNDPAIEQDRPSYMHASVPPMEYLIKSGFRGAIKQLIGPSQVPKLGDTSEVAALCASLSIEPRLYFLTFGSAYFAQQYAFWPIRLRKKECEWNP